MPLVLAAVFVILVGLLRSLVAPLMLLVAVVAVVAVWGAALGIGGLVFGPVLGFGGTDSGLGLLSFVFLVALGVDYGIFLMHRMSEESVAGAVARGGGAHRPAHHGRDPRQPHHGQAGARDRAQLVTVAYESGLVTPGSM